jgi:hypothetical protein
MLDTMCYATAAALKSGVNGIADTGWARLEAALEGAPMPAAPPPSLNMAPEEYTPQPERKTIPAIDQGGWIGARPNWFGGPR